jgi:parallel beta-helix repeat protein
MNGRRNVATNALVVVIIAILLGTILMSAVGTNSCLLTPDSEICIANDIQKISHNGHTLYVGGSGPNNYSKIQDAINDASNGDTVFVYDDSSPYYENVVVNKSINLIGENRETTIIDGGGSRGIIIWISIDGVDISGFTLKNSSGIGITILSNGNTIYENNIIDHNSECIFLDGSDNIITNNLIETHRQHSGEGIRCYGNNNTIRENIICDNFIEGVFVGSDYNIIIRNYISNNGHGIDFMDSDYNAIRNNNITENGIGIVMISDCDGRGGLHNEIHYNNFINNEQHVCHLHYGPLSIVDRNNWNANYWDDWSRIIPKPIWGWWCIRPYFTPMIPWPKFDWHPLIEPYGGWLNE